MGEEMVAVPIKEFISGSKIPVDTYIRLGNTKYVLLARAGETIQMDRLTTYESKQVDHLYIRKAEYSKYLEKNMTIAGIVLSRPEFDNRRKVEVLGTTMIGVFQELELVGLSDRTFEQAKSIFKSTITLVESKPVLADLLEALARLSDDLLAHSMAVSLISIGVGECMGWTQSVTLEKLALGGLFHDIGMRQLPKALITKPYALLDFEEIQALESHPQRGVQIMQSMGFIPEDVISIIHEHQENMAGQGYPRRLKHHRVHPLARVVALADAFSEHILKSMNNPNPKNALEALKYIVENQGPLFAKEAIKGLDQFVFQTSRKKIA
ncbi:MAG: HD-GYP domain-containing protein [Bdellovibrionales bacterium]